MQANPGGASVRACLLDNRGVGRSGSPKARQAYTTAIMADDCIAVLVRHTTFCIKHDDGPEKEIQTTSKHNTDSEKNSHFNLHDSVLMTPRSRSAY